MSTNSEVVMNLLSSQLVTNLENTVNSKNFPQVGEPWFFAHLLCLTRNPTKS